MKNNDKQFNRNELIEIAKQQKILIILIILTLIIYPICTLYAYLELNDLVLLITAVSLFLKMLYVYKLAKALFIKNSWVYFILPLISYVNLAVYIYLIVESVKVLKKNNIRVGILGAKISDIISLEIKNDKS